MSGRRRGGGALDPFARFRKRFAPGMHFSVLFPFWAPVPVKDDLVPFSFFGTLPESLL